MRGDRTVTVWHGIARGDEIEVKGERKKFVFQSARMDGDQCLWFTATYHLGTKRSGTRVFNAERIIDLGMVLG